MIPRLGLRSAATGALLTVAATAGLAGPASAAAEGGPVITIDSPREGQVFDSSSVTVSGNVAAAAPVGLGIYTLRNVTLTVGGQTFPIACSDSPCPFSRKVPLATNDRYKVTVSADQQSPIGAVVAAPSGARTVTFDVAAPPETPVLDPPKVTDGRTVELTWSRNTEPDMRYYAVFRRDPGASNFSRIGGNVAQPASGKTVTFTDTTTVFNGGAYAYLVAAVRRGALDGTEKSSGASAAVTATVPGSPTSSTPGPPGGPGAGPTTTAKAGPPAGVDLGGFLSSRSQPAALPPITVPEPPDPGFGSTLPFGAKPEDDVEPGGDEAAIAPSRGSNAVVRAADARRPLVPVAAGLVLLVLAMHLRLLNRRLKPAGDLPLGPPLPEAQPPKKAVRALPARQVIPQPIPPRRRPEHAAQPRPAAQENRPYDVVQERDWAPREDPEPDPGAQPLVAAEPPPEPEPLVVAPTPPGPDPEPLLLAAREPTFDPQPEPRPPEPRPFAPSRPQTAPDPELLVVGGSAPAPQPQPPAVAEPEPALAPVARSEPGPDQVGAASVADGPEEPEWEPEPEPGYVRAAEAVASPSAPDTAPEHDPEETWASEALARPPGPAADRQPQPVEVWAAPVGEGGDEPGGEPEPDDVWAAEPEPVPEAEAEPQPEPEPEEIWTAEALAEPSPPASAPEPDLEPAGADREEIEEIEVFEVVSPRRRRLVRSGRS